jgi:hypothetical protein
MRAKEYSMAQETKHFIDEPDIGSGEKTPGQKDVEADVRRVNGTIAGAPQDGSQLHQGVEEQQYANQRPASAEQQDSRMLQSGNHLARILAVRQEDGTYEAQVFVRLTREPEVAETYIPAGVFPDEMQAWQAAEERARRAFQENEF